MALLHDPDVLFFDEPTSGLDVHSAQLVRNEIIKLNKAGKTANDLCNEIIVLNKGKIVATGSPDDLRKKYIPTSKITLEFPETVKKDIFRESGFKYRLDIPNKTVTFFSTSPLDDFSTIKDFFSSHSLTISRIEIVPASFEEIFLKILGENKS